MYFTFGEHHIFSNVWWQPMIQWPRWWIRRIPRNSDASTLSCPFSYNYPQTFVSNEDCWILETKTTNQFKYWGILLPINSILNHYEHWEAIWLCAYSVSIRQILKRRKKCIKTLDNIVKFSDMSTANYYLVIWRQKRQKYICVSYNYFITENVLKLPVIIKLQRAG